MIISEKQLVKIALYSNALYVFLLFMVVPEGVNIKKITITGLLILSVLIALIIGITRFNRLKSTSSTVQYIFYLLIAWSIIVIIRGVSFSLQDLVTNFGNVYMALAWLCPVMIFVGLKIENWAVVFKAIVFMFKLMVLAWVLFLLNIGSIAEEWVWLLRPVNFIILMSFYVRKIISKTSILIIIALYIFMAQKTNLRLEYLFLFFVLFLLVIEKISSIRIRKIMYRWFIIVFGIIMIIVFTVGYESLSSIASAIVEYQDSRTFLFVELFEDMSFREEVFGRGSMGSYYSDFFSRTRRYYEITGTSWRGDSAQRITIEVGYLQMILKGGFIMLVLQLLLSFHAVYLALFKSKNKFIKRLGMFVLTIAALSLVSFRPAFTPTFIIYWIAIGSILSKKYRLMEDEEIEKLIRIK